MKIINFKKKKTKLRKEQQQSYEIVIIQGNIEVLHIAYLKYSAPKNIHIVFHNGSNYDYHFIIKELAEEFKKQFTCFGENPEKYITFTVPIAKEVTRIDKNEEEIIKNVCYILQFIDSARFMASSSSNLIKNLSEGIHRIKCKFRHDNKKRETCRIKYKYCDCFLEYTNFKDYLIEYKCLCCNQNYERKFDEKLKERFFIHIKFLTMITISVYPYEYMHDWEKFNETSLPEKEDFCSHLNMEDITDTDYAHAERVCKDFAIKKLGEYHNLYVQRYTFMLADVFEKFRNMCLKIYKLDPAKFLSAPGLAW